jgi:peroxiredoxin
MRLKKLPVSVAVPALILIFSLYCGKKVKIPDVGDTAPDFTLKNQVQMNVTLSNFRGKKNIILVFYALDFSPICAGELADYRKNIWRLKELNIEVIGISVDSFASHAAFKKDLVLPFDLLSDWDRNTAKRYGIFNEKERVANRFSFLIDKTGVVRYRQNSGLSEARDLKSMLKRLKKLRKGGKPINRERRKLSLSGACVNYGVCQSQFEVLNRLQ